MVVANSWGVPLANFNEQASSTYYFKSKNRRSGQREDKQSEVLKSNVLALADAIAHSYLYFEHKGHKFDKLDKEMTAYHRNIFSKLENQLSFNRNLT